jgi:hypothetical protein
MDTMQSNSSIISSDTISTKPATVATPLRKCRALPLVLCVFATIIVLFFLNKLLPPKYMSDIYEGAMVAEYYNSARNHELIVIGDCEVYENISPITLWEDYGITSYIRGSPQQLIWQSYYLLEDTLRYEKPQAVIYSVLAMKYGAPQSEAYNRLTLDGMRLSTAKIGAVNASMTEGESLISYLFPLFRFHDRWKGLALDDFRYLFEKRGVSFNGFLMRCDTKPMGTLPTPPKLGNYALSENTWKYLDKMTQLCKENGVELILLKAPVPYPHWYPEWDAQVADYANNHGLLYINALDELDNIGIDFSTDTYDGGLHLNLAGAEKLSGYLGNILSGRGLGDLRNSDGISMAWEEKVRQYYALKDIQLAEIEIKGKAITLTRE